MQRIVKAVFLDIDGTLFDLQEHQITSDNIRALQQARDNGVLLFIASGRHLTTPSEVKILQPVLPFMSGIVSTNGQHCLLMDGTVISHQDIDPQDFQAMVALSLEHDLALLYSDEKMTYITQVNQRVRDFAARMKINLPPERPVCQDDPPMMKATLYVTVEEENAWVRPLLKHSIPERWCEELVDLVPVGIGKETGMQVMGDYFGFELHECMAIGDGGNDISMIKAAGAGVAMGNALEIVKESADYITSSCVESGVAQAFRHYGLI